MSQELVTAVERSVRRVRRRLIGQRLLNNFAVCTAGGLALGLVWFLAEPWLIDRPPEWLRWAVVGGCALLGIVSAVVSAILLAPSRESAALELDKRFDLRERVTTALGLRPYERDTPAGLAVVSDAVLKVAPLTVADKFPVRPRWPSLLVPGFAGLIALAFFFYQPETGGSLGADEAKEEAKKKLDGSLAAAKPKPTVPFTQQRPADKLARKEKSEDLKELESQLDKLMEKWAKEPVNEEKKREKVSEMTAMEEKLKKFQDEKFQKMAQLEQALNKLERLNKDKDFEDGPVKALNEALGKGDLKKAKDEIDELSKKVKEKSLSKEDLAKLDRQMEKMKQAAEEIARNKEKEEKVKDLLDKARKDGREKDADALQRELEKMQSENKQSNEVMEKMAKQMQKMKDAAQSGDMESMAEQLAEMKAQLKEMENELEDLGDGDEHLQRLKQELKQACKKCQGECEGECDKEKDGAKWTDKGQIGKGRRDEDKTGATASTDERIRGLFDPKGKKSFGGSVKGQAFTKRTTLELGQEIQQAAQEAPQSADTQRLPRDAQTAVKEYFEKIGGTGPNK